MPLTPGLRKLALTAHVTSSVGWLGAVAAFLALAVAGLSGTDPRIVRAAYVAMEVTTWFVIVPLSFASLVTGLVESLATPWGLFRHYWVLTKLLIASLATILLLVHTRVVAHVSGVALETSLAAGDLRPMRIQLVADAGAAVVALLVATALSVYKPHGLTPYGLRNLGEGRQLLDPVPRTQWNAWLLAGIITLLLIVVLMHLAGTGLHGH